MLFRSEFMMSCFLSDELDILLNHTFRDFTLFLNENTSIMVYFGGSAKLDRQNGKTNYPFESVY